MRIFLSILFIAFLSACGHRPQPVPEYVLPEEKMVDIMLDMHLVETAHNLKLIAPDSTRQPYQEMFAAIYVSNEVTKERFDSSLYYYATETQLMHVIYDKVLERMSELEAEVNAKQQNQPPS